MSSASTLCCPLRMKALVLEDGPGPLASFWPQPRGTATELPQHRPEYEKGPNSPRGGGCPGRRLQDSDFVLSAASGLANFHPAALVQSPALGEGTDLPLPAGLGGSVGHPAVAAEGSAFRAAGRLQVHLCAAGDKESHAAALHWAAA